MGEEEGESEGERVEERNMVTCLLGVTSHLTYLVARLLGTPFRHTGQRFCVRGLR